MKAYFNATFISFKHQVGVLGCTVLFLGCGISTVAKIDIISTNTYKK